MPYILGTLASLAHAECAGTRYSAPDPQTQDDRRDGRDPPRQGGAAPVRRRGKAGGIGLKIWRPEL